MAGLLLALVSAVGFSDHVPAAVAGVSGEEGTARPDVPSPHWFAYVSIYDTLKPVVLILMEAPDLPNGERAWPHPSISVTPMRGSYRRTTTASTPRTDPALGEPTKKEAAS